MIPFVKAHACGNDFLIVDESDADGNHAQIARLLCSRHHGIGADGVEFVDRRKDDSNFLRLFNADGSEAEISGNGTRCVAAWLADKASLTSVQLLTHAGPRSCQIVKAASPEFLISTEMGVPQMHEQTIRLDAIGEVTGAVVNVGNPHFVLFTSDPDFRSHAHPWEVLGAYICTHPSFPKQINVEFVHVKSPTEIEFRIYERGAGPTQSSGTGTCASATAAMLLHKCARTLTATSLGGAQQVDWPADSAPMMLTGPARLVCEGKAFPPQAADVDA